MSRPEFFQAFFLQLQKIIADLQGPLLLLTSIGSSNKIYFIKNCDKILSHKAEQHEDVDNIKRVSNTELNLSTQEHSPIYLLNQAEIWHWKYWLYDQIWWNAATEKKTLLYISTLNINKWRREKNISDQTFITR